ncbi:hypothetical protein ES703_87143 [subsurface metagenome]
MPIYEFRCQQCEEVSEFLVYSGSNSEILTCPNCGSQDLERILSVPNVLKGRDNAPGTTCCGRTERCDSPPCSTDERCRRG